MFCQNLILDFFNKYFIQTLNYSQNICFTTFLLIFIIYLSIKLIILNNYVKDLKTKKLPKGRNELSESPQNFPNGWIPVLELRQIKNNEIKNIRCFGQQLVVFRGNSSRVYVLNAFCPHLGANLGVRGEVVTENGDDCIRCPFHGWYFRGEDGVCVKIPELKAGDIPKAQVKVWPSIEFNDIIFVWHHSQHLEPNWFLKPIDEIKHKSMRYAGSIEHTINCHFQELTENTADISHFRELHGQSLFSGTSIDKMCFSMLSKIFKYKMSIEWHTSDNPDESHIAVTTIDSFNTLFGYPLFDFNFELRQIGPSLIVFKYSTKSFGGQTGIWFQLITPIDHGLTRSVESIYCEPNFISKLVAKFMLKGANIEIEKDIKNWNQKIYIKNGIFTKREKSLIAFRRWFRQFYSEAV